MSLTQSLAAIRTNGALIIDERGVIRPAYADPDYRFRAEPSETIDAVRNLTLAPTAQ
jgi:hypothetical protein